MTSSEAFFKSTILNSPYRVPDRHWQLGEGGRIESGDGGDIAVWFIDTDYNYESFFVRPYFPGANDPCKALKTTLKTEVDHEAWDSLNRVRSRPFTRPKEGRVAVKVVNHLSERWSRFCWFGIVPVTEDWELDDEDEIEFDTDLPAVLNHIEAILIATAEPPLNLQRGRFGSDVEKYLQEQPVEED